MGKNFFSGLLFHRISFEMLWTLVCFLCTQVSCVDTSSDSAFYRTISSGICEDADCNSLSADECEKAFNLMTSQSGGSPRPEQYLESSSRLYRPEGCLPVFDMDNPSLQFNDISQDWEIEASTNYPVYCLCSDSITNTEFEQDFKQERGEFESAVEWCDGWMGDLEIDPLEAWTDSGGAGTPSVLFRSLGSDLDSTGAGLAFQPGAALVDSSVKSIGIRFLELPEGIELLATLQGGRSCSHSSGVLTCEEEESSILFSETPLTPGKGREETVYFVDLFGVTLNVSWTYFLVFTWPNSFMNDMIVNARLPVWHPTHQEPWAYQFRGAVYFDSVQALFLDETTGNWIGKLTFPQILFKLCAPLVEEPEMNESCSDVQDFLSFNCSVWIYTVLSILVLLCLLCCCYYSCINRQTGQAQAQQNVGAVRTKPLEGSVYLNFVDFETGERWYLEDVLASCPIRRLCIDIARLMDKPSSSTSLWLAPSQRLRWCYRVGDYNLSYTDIIYVVHRSCNSICGCCSIEDLISCIPPPDFSTVNGQGQPNTSQTQMTRLIPHSGQTWVDQPIPTNQINQRFYS